MKRVVLLTLMCLVAVSSPLWAIIDIFTEIVPSDKAEGYHTKIKLEKDGAEKVLVTLPRYGEESFEMDAWLVVCKEERKDGNRNFRYQVDWMRCKATSKDIEMVVPVEFGGEGIATFQLDEDKASRSYIVFGGFFDDGEFATVNLPAFLKAMEE